MNFTHLVVSGCSWTYCQGLEDPKTQGWPRLLANKLGCEVVNIACPGSGNDSIYRRSLEYVYENLPTGSKPLFVIYWSQYWRREVWHEYRHPNNELCKDFDTIYMPNPGEKDLGFYEQALLEHYNEEEFYRRAMLSKFSAISLFKSFDIPYIMSDGMYEQYTTETIDNIKNRFPNMFESFQHLDECTPMYRIATDIKKLPCGHEPAEAMPYIAQEVYDGIIKKYGEIKVIPHDNFLTLKNFKLYNSRQIKWHAWY